MKTRGVFLSICAMFLILCPGFLMGEELQKEFKKSFDIGPNALMVLKNYRGPVSIQAKDGQAVEVNALIKVVHDDADAAREILENTEVAVLESSLSKLDIEVKVDRDLLNNVSTVSGFWNSLMNAWNRSLGPVLEITFDVVVPREIDLDIRTERAPLSIRDIQGQVDAANHRGSIVLEEIRGPLSAETERAEMKLINIGGEIRARNHRGSIDISDAEGDVDAQTERANMNLGNIHGNVLAKNHRGVITATHVSGSIIAETERADIVLDAIGYNIEATNDRGAIHIKEAQNSVIAHTERGNIDAEISWVQPDSRLEFENERGQILICLPEDTGADVFISVERGEIQSEFPLKIQGTISKSSVEGFINNGGIPLTIHNSSGSVELRKL